jgi:predicted DNA-binding protein
MKTILAARITDDLKTRLDYIQNQTNTKLNIGKIIRSAIEKEIEVVEKNMKLKAKN